MPAGPRLPGQHPSQPTPVHPHSPQPGPDPASSIELSKAPRKLQPSLNVLLPTVPPPACWPDCCAGSGGALPTLGLGPLPRTTPSFGLPSLSWQDAPPCPPPGSRDLAQPPHLHPEPGLPLPVPRPPPLQAQPRPQPLPRLQGPRGPPGPSQGGAPHPEPLSLWADTPGQRQPHPTKASSEAGGPPRRWGGGLGLQT